MFYENLKSIRLKQGLSQKKVADYLNISPQSISKWENDEAQPSVSFLPQLAECLGCEINDFFKQEDKKYDVKIILQYFSVIKEFSETEGKDFNEVVRFLFDYSDIGKTIESLGEDIKKYKFIKKISIKSIFDCSEEDAANLIRCLQDFEWIEMLEPDEYFVLKSNIDGSILLSKELILLREFLGEKDSAKKFC